MWSLKKTWGWMWRCQASQASPTSQTSDCDAERVLRRNASGPFVFDHDFTRENTGCLEARSWYKGMEKMNQKHRQLLYFFLPKILRYRKPKQNVRIFVDSIFAGYIHHAEEGLGRRFIWKCLQGNLQVSLAQFCVGLVEDQREKPPKSGVLLIVQ